MSIFTSESITNFQTFVQYLRDICIQIDDQWSHVQIGALVVCTFSRRFVGV